MNGFNCFLELWPRSAPSGPSVLDILLEKDLTIIAAGSLSCIRGVYRACKRKSCTDRLIPCLISDREYALGKNMDILRACIRKALEQNRRSGIILYVSCAEVMMNCDYNGIIQSLANPQNIPVIPFFRGPLISRRVNLRASARKIADRIPPISGPTGRIALPVPAPDFEGIHTMASDWGYESILLTPGGCTGCMRESEGSQLIKTGFNDLFVSTGSWDSLAQLLAGQCVPGKHYTILKAAVPAMMTVGKEDFARISENRFLHIADSCGWRSACQGMESFLLSEIKRWIKEQSPKPKKNSLCILGYSSLINGEKASAEAFAASLGKMVDAVSYWTPFQDTLPEENLVVSFVGLEAAEYLHQCFGIPYTIASWIPEKVQTDLDAAVRSATVNTIGVTGDPIIINEVANYLHRIRQDLAITKIVYSPLSEEASCYRRRLGPDYTVCDSETDLETLCQGFDALVADPCFEAWLLPSKSLCKVIPLPYRVLGAD